MKMTQAAATYFDQVADDWDALRTGYFPEAVRDAAIAHAYLRPEMVVADVGCGTGFIAAGLASHVNQVYALDGSPAMLAVAQRNLASHANIIYQATDGSVLPLPDASVDAVFANMYLHHCPDPAEAIREMARILRPGGRLAPTDLDQHGHAWLRAEMADEWLGFDRTQVKAWLREAGLVNVLVDDASSCCCATPAAGEAAPCADPQTNHAEIGIFVATGTRRVTGAQAAVQARYGAVAASAPGCCSPAPAAIEFAADIPLSGSCCAPAPAEFSADIPLSASCCAPENAMPQVAGAPAATEFVWNTGYSLDQIAAVPAEAAAISLGCGNPTALAALRPGETVLDIGSGGGIDAFFAASRVGPQGHVIGLDMTPAMIERARQAAADAGRTNVEFRLGQAEAMPVAAETVDVILSNCVINLCEDKGRVFEEAYRVLRTGGRLAISDMVTDQPLPLSLRHDPGQWAGCISGALPEREYLDLVRAAGFNAVQAARSLSRGQIGDATVYSLSVTAQK